MERISNYSIYVHYIKKTDARAVRPYSDKNICSICEICGRIIIEL